MTIVLEIADSTPGYGLELKVPFGHLQTWPEEGREMSGSMVEVIETSTTPRMGRRSMALSDIDPKYVSQSGIWEASEVETSRGSIRIQHLTTAALTSAGCRASGGSVTSASGAVGGIGAAGGSISGPPGTVANNPRFPKLEECAHFHYDCVELPILKIQIRDDPSKPISQSGDESPDKCAFSIEVIAGGQSWAIRRTHTNIQMLDSQLHRCVWDRTFSLLDKVHQESIDQPQQHNECREFVAKYLTRLSELPTNKITCGTVLSWLELDNRGRHIVSSDDSAINTPAVAAACAKRKYVAQAADEISFEVGDMISVIDMPPPEDSIWWRGKRGFHVGFFPRDYVQVIDKVPAGLPTVPSVRRLQRLSVSSSSSSSSAPDKPVLRKHGKLIAFFRSFILSRPSRRRLKQSGILRERVFSCDLAEHLLNTGNDIPTVLKCCSEFIEKHGIVDGVYRLSGITSNIQKLRNAFDEDKIPNLEGDLAIKQDIHAVSSLLKMYFRELPNPLCTYQLYEKFVTAAKESDEDRLLKMREVVHELPPPHYRTLEYLMKHLSRVAQRSSDTGMTPKNMAIVWAPNLIRCRELEAGGVAALKGIGVQAVVTEYLIRHADLIFNDKLPENFPTTTTVLTQKSSGSSSRPKSLAISSPIKLMSLEEAQDKAKDDRKYIEVGGGPSSLPPQYHTVIELPGRRGMKSKRSPMGWKHFFSRNRSFSKPQRKMFTPGDITVITRSMPVAGPQGMQTNWAGRLRPVKSVESLVSTPLYNTNSSGEDRGSCGRDLDSESVMEEMEASLSKSSPATPVTTEAHIIFHKVPQNGIDPRSLQNSKTHNRSISHDSYFEFGEFRNSNNVYIDETLEEETMSQSSKLSMELSSSELESNVTSPVKTGCTNNANSTSNRSKSEERERFREPFKSPMTPPPSAASLVPLSHSTVSTEEITSSSSKHGSSSASSMFVKPRPRPSKWRDSEVQTSQLKLSDVGCCTEDNPYNICSTKEKPVGVDSSTYVSMDEEFGKYEYDKNSSFDESSEMSTPEEHFPNTNIVYSPLVNEVSSTSSTEKFDILHGSISSTPTRKQPSNSNRSSTSAEDYVTNASAKVCLFVCPLYEAGVTSEDFNSWDTNLSQSRESSGVISTQTPTLKDTSSSKDHLQTDSEPEAKIATAVPEPQYQNENVCSESLPSQLSSTITTMPMQAEVNIPQIKEVCHIYENDRIYQNQPIAPIRKRTGILPAQPSANATSTSTQDIGLSAPTAEPESMTPTPKPKAKEPLPSTCIETGSIYEGRGDEHYENISESHYEANIYEDIDSENEKQNEYSRGSTGSCRYETVQAPSSSRENLTNQDIGADRHKDKIVPNNNANKSVQIQDSSEDEDSANYESVRFQKVADQLLPVAHHYSEIEDKTPTPEEERSKSELDSQRSTSTPSHSRTEEMVTYLEVQTPSFKLRSDSLDEQKSEEISSYESVGVKNSETVDDAISPESVEDEIRFIDSPLVVENPVYTLEMEGIDPETKAASVQDDDDLDISMNESISISMSLEEDNSKSGKSPKTKPTKDLHLKLLGRCNSAPLAETRQDFIITEILRQSEELENTRSTSSSGAADLNLEKNEHGKLTLCKRLSEPTLLTFSNSNSLSLKTDDNSAAAAAWKLADAKRLANRKQSVKELLSKFEGRDSTPSSTNSLPTSTLGRDTQGPGPGLPKPLSQTQKANTTGRKPFGSGRFQHHRFSMGDILMTQSVSDAEDLNSIGRNSASPKNSMVRSDTYPELRSSSLKIPGMNSKTQLASKENLGVVIIDRGSQSSSSSNDGSGPLVAEKVQQAIRVAMSSVDMNDPMTRERIEKYKEERRTFLRQKITSEISPTIDLKSPVVDEEKNPNLTPKEIDIEISNEMLFGRLNSSESTRLNNRSSSDSPRKRAFSEDVPPTISNSYSTKTKTIKTESEPLKYLEESSSIKSTTTQEEINVKEKIALWTVQKKEVSKSTVSCTEISKTASDPSQKQFVRPILRREVTTSSIEISKCKLNVSRVEGSGKKIKDMAAFFEAKRF